MDPACKAVLNSWVSGMSVGAARPGSPVFDFYASFIRRSLPEGQTYALACRRYPSSGGRGLQTAASLYRPTGTYLSRNSLSVSLSFCLALSLSLSRAFARRTSH